MTKKRAGQRVGYVRVSTLDQRTDRQLEGIELDRRFADKASGKDAQRPQLQAALEYLREGDTLIVHSMDRLARNVRDLLSIVEALTGRGVSVEFVSNNLRFTGDGDSPMSRLMLTVLGAVAEFERALILERQREGIALAKARGVYRGRRPSLSEEQTQELVRRAEAGEAVATLAREFGISRETAYQRIRNATGAQKATANARTPQRSGTPQAPLSQIHDPI